MGRELICDCAWAAGFFDGEGCTRTNLFSSRGRKYMYLVIQITQMTREPLDRFQRIMGCGNVYTRKDGSFIFQCSKQDEVHEILEKMWPFLCSVKRAQANDAIEKAIGRVA